MIHCKWHVISSDCFPSTFDPCCRTKRVLFTGVIWFHQPTCFSLNTTSKTLSMTSSRSWRRPGLTPTLSMLTVSVTRCAHWTRWLHTMCSRPTRRRTRTRSESSSPRPPCSTPRLTESSCMTRWVGDLWATSSGGLANLFIPNLTTLVCTTADRIIMYD